jgi:excisionase family DNA binding protein
MSATKEREAVTTTQAMQMLGVSRATVTRLARRGQLEGYRLTLSPQSELRIYVDSIEEFKRLRQL